ncbi:MAG: universal stress protein [Pseudomonadota bacterium]|nr:universal stress protein [Pseudomonadota bacterium]
MKKKTDKQIAEKQLAKRILVTLEHSGYGMSVLRVAAGMAAELQGELLGLLVEDTNLIRLAELPFSREVSLFAEGGYHLCLDTLEKQLRFQAERLRHNLESIAGQRKIPWSFRLTRGRLAMEIMAVMREVDVLIMGQMRGFFSERRPLPAEGLLTQGFRQPIMVFFDGSLSSGRALKTAALLARKNSERLVVILPAVEPDRLSELEQQVVNWQQQTQLQLRFMNLLNNDISALVQLGRGRQVGALILGQDSFSLDEHSINKLLDYSDCPVVLVK